MFKRKPALIDKLDLDRLEIAVRGVRDARDVEKTDSFVFFKFLDRDGDYVGVFVAPVGEARALATMMITIPPTYLVTAVIATNVYNSYPDSHGTFAYAQKVEDDRALAIIETDISVSGGVTAENIRAQLQYFTDRINKFEVCVLDTMRDLGPDSEFLKGSFWSALGSFFGGFLKGFSASNCINS
jgi:hypothetical protein